ncbi:MAG: hypothetical protein L3K17_01180 [Thermoplasmata archaeon]|nr:hypothetical protein [Thermoplasmata archaeon]
MEPRSRRWARFGPSDRRLNIHVPNGGVCLSAFVKVRNRDGDVLLGRPRSNPIWTERGCLPPWRVREIQRAGEWILPASHLMMGEHPDRAAERIARDFLGLPHASLRFLGIDSGKMLPRRQRGRSSPRPGRFHWTLGFVYETTPAELPPPLPSWTELKFLPTSRRGAVRIGRAHRDIIAAAGSFG